MPRARNLSEFLAVVERTIDQWEGDGDQYYDPWFRGQGRASFSLVPSYYRYDLEANIDEDHWRDEFNSKAFPFLKEMRSQNIWEAYALMQHYGLPTRLLDWSESALVALHFALAVDRPEHDTAVWMLDPWLLNEVTQNYEWVLNPSQAEKYLHEPYQRGQLPAKPAAVQIPYNSPRISAQRGLFTIHGNEREPLESYLVDHPDRCFKIVIPADRIIPMRRQLFTAGVSESLLFPELGALCRDLRRHWLDDREDVPQKQPHAARANARGRRRKD